ncbi:MAG: hypothetical protein JWP31_1737 [Aeromicrobium sp.]|nr:hypothetical protein [Aeromicrobium sp.]
MLTRARAVVLAAAALTLAACSNVHPGSAAVVDGTSISMHDLDDTAKVYCEATVATAQDQGQGAAPVSNLEMRRQAITGMVTLIVARKLAKDEGVKVAPSAYELNGQQRDEIARSFPDSDIDDIAKVIQDIQEVSATAMALAEKATGEKATADNQDDLAQVGQAAITAAFADNDVHFARRLGLNPSGESRADTGSLSVAPVDLEAPTVDELPVSQRCS